MHTLKFYPHIKFSNHLLKLPFQNTLQTLTDGEMHDPVDSTADTPLVSQVPTAVPLVEDRLAAKISVTAHLKDQRGRVIELDPEGYRHVDLWDLLLCPSVLVSRKEVLLLLAERVLKKRTREAMITISNMDMQIGRHVAVTMSSGGTLHYYGVPAGSVQNKFPTWVEVAGYDKVSRRSNRLTSRLACVVCAIQLNNVIIATGQTVPAELRDVHGISGKESVTFLLVKYAAPHESATQRGPDHRPLCPGPLKHSHCLWKWAARPSGYTRGCFRPRPWERNKRYFGRSPEQQEAIKRTELRAWYDIIQVTNIKCYANVHRIPSIAASSVFLQSLIFS